MWTYAGDDILNQMPYISTVLHPVPTVTFLGRDASIEPSCKVYFTVWSWFQDPAATNPPLPCPPTPSAFSCDRLLRPSPSPVAQPDFSTLLANIFRRISCAL